MNGSALMQSRRRPTPGRLERSRYPLRTGSAYVMVLACAVIVTAITLGGVALNKAQRDAYQTQDQIRRARLAAASALEACTQLLSPTLAGRRSFADVLPKQIDGVELEYSIVDPIDGNLTDDVTEPIEVTVEARIGVARQMITGRLAPRFAPIGMTKYGLGATEAIKLSNTKVDARAGMYSGSGVSASSSYISGATYSTGSMSGDTYLNGTNRVSAASSFDTSDPTELFNAATRISYSAISGGRIDSVVISPTINPYGAATNARGIYLIDCGGQRLRIRHTRIIGTLIVLNAKSDSQWEVAVNASTFDARLPAIVWYGGLTISTTSADLTETIAGVTLNPVGAPYNGQSDTDKIDQYPSLVTGSMVVVGDLTVQGGLSIDGRLTVVGNLGATDSIIRVREDPDNSVPDCLHEPDGFELVWGYVRREVDAP